MISLNQTYLLLQKPTILLLELMISSLRRRYLQISIETRKLKNKLSTPSQPHLKNNNQ
uniref:Uncharacterized protein n=1 Tax=Lotus japonicus TaxID=34305 RepID=I3SKU0_LOTJA|nr:unknown [Lotus japonicus]